MAPATEAGIKTMPRNNTSASSTTSPNAKVRPPVDTEPRECNVVKIACAELRDDGSGGIVEAPKVLKQAEVLRERLARLLKGRAMVEAIVVSPGQYEFEVKTDGAQGDLLAGRNIQDLIIPALAHAAKIIEDNARNHSPKTAAELGVAPELLYVQHTLAEIFALGLTATIRGNDGDELSSLPCVRKDALSAIAREPKARQRILGIVTGVGLERDGIRIEINRRMRPAISGMTLENVIPFLHRPTQVMGYLVYEDERVILDEPIFQDSLETESFGF